MMKNDIIPPYFIIGVKMNWQKKVSRLFLYQDCVLVLEQSYFYSVENV